jgi:glycosyltransferase involved in cell wall biosynthesis
MSSLGIAVITYRRRASFDLLIEKLALHTKTPHELVIADDGSEDGIVNFCRSRGIWIVSGSNHGVAWNKNRAIFPLEMLGCDPILIVEDDVYPNVTGWERDWISATSLWHHLAYEHPRIADQRMSGSGTPEDPFINPKASAALLSISAAALLKVGYFDSRFVGYGHEHAEWTTRIKRAGYGYRAIIMPDGTPNEGLLYMTSGIEDNEGERWIDREQMAINRTLQRKTQYEPIFRRPWRSPLERTTFLGEQADAGFDGEAFADVLDRRFADQPID